MVDKKLIKAASWIGMGNIAAQTVAFSIFVILSWLFTKEEYGYIRWVLQMGLLFATISVVGFPPALARFIAASKGNLKKSSVYFSNTIYGISIVMSITLFISFIIFKDAYLLLAIVGFVPALLYVGLLRGFVEYKKIGLFNFLRNTVKLLLIGILFVYPLLRSVLYVVITYAFGGWLIMFVLEKWNPLSIHFNKKYISSRTLKELIRFSAFTFVGTISYSFIPSVSYTLLGIKYGYSSVAIFSIALTICILYTFVPNAINTILMPKIAANHLSTKNSYYLKQAIFMTILFSTVIFILIYFFGSWGIEMLFGIRYLDSYRYLLILSVGSIFAGLRNNFTALWQGINRPEISSSDIVLAAITTSLGGLLFMDLVGPIGMAIGYSMGFATAFVFDLFIYFYYFNTKKS